MKGCLIFFVMLFVLMVWSVIGFVFWIPFLVRSIFMFSAGMLYVVFTNQDPSSLGKVLEFATLFYIDGFRKIAQAIYRKTDASEYGTGKIEFHLGRLLVEIIWASFFWLTLLFTLSKLGWLPEFLKQNIHWVNPTH